MSEMHTVQHTPLHARDYTLIIDKSTSMDSSDALNGPTRWKVAAELAEGVARKICQLDPDGIDIWLFSSTYKFFPNQSAEKVKEIFKGEQPFGTTALAEVLQKALDNFFAKRDSGRLKLNGELIIVVTDGDADNKWEVKRVLVNGSNRLRPNDKLTVAFFPMGNDPALAKFMNELDTDLVREGASRDYVEVMKMSDIEQQGIQQVLMNTLAKEPRASVY